MSLFSPKWKSKNRDKRKAWVTKANIELEKNIDILKQLAKKDDDIEVKQLAEERIKEIEEMNSLLDIVKNTEIDTKDNKRIVQKIKKIKNQKFLADIAESAKDDTISEAAVKVLEDQNLLARIAKNNEHENVRMLAIGKLEDRSTIVAILKNIEEDYEKSSALARIKNIKLALDIAKNDLNLRENEVIYYMFVHNSSLISKHLKIPKDSIILKCPDCGAIFHANDMNLQMQWKMLKGGGMMMGGLKIHCVDCNEVNGISSYFETSSILNS